MTMRIMWTVRSQSCTIDGVAKEIDAENVGDISASLKTMRVPWWLGGLGV